MARNATFYDGSWETFGERMVEEVQAGERPHGGNFNALLHGDPEVAFRTLDKVLETMGVEPPVTPAYLATEVFEWNQPVDAQAFIAEHSREQ